MSEQPPVTFAVVLYEGVDVPNHSKGIFNEEWVTRLYHGIARNMKRPFRFVCFVDREDYDLPAPIEQKMLQLPYRNMFCLLEPFREDLGRVIFMGLDTVITGSLEQLVGYDGPFAMLRDPNYVTIGCSGVMSFPYTPSVWETFLRERHTDRNEFRLGGHKSDMMFLNTVPHEYLDDSGIRGIYSYKVHIKREPSLIERASIVYFHGREKPHELTHLPWIRKHWIGEDLPNG